MLNITPAEMVTVILGIVGIILQFVYKNAPKISEWYDKRTNKGLWAFGLDAVVGAAIFGLSCTPFLAQFNIALTCNNDGFFVLIKSIFIIISAQQLTYLGTRNSTPAAPAPITVAK